MTALLEAIKTIVEEGFKITTALALILFWRKHQSSKRLANDIKVIKEAVTCHVDETACTNDTEKISLTQSYKAKSYAGFADKYTQNRGTSLYAEATEMKEYLKKLGRTKLQAVIVATIMNVALLIGYFANVQDIQEKVDAWMPMFNMAIQTVLTILYVWVEGSIDKAKVTNTAVVNTTTTTGGSYEEFKTSTEHFE